MTEEHRRAAIVTEALRQMESCLYTSTAIFQWLRPVKRNHTLLILVPIILTAIVGFSYAKELLPAWTVAAMGLLSTLVPSIAKAVDFETHVSDLKSAASEYKSLQDRFRQLAQIGALSDVDAAEARLSELMDRLDVVRAKSITVPEKYFEEAQTKIKQGHYDFSVDIDLRSLAEKGAVALPPSG